MNLFGMDSDRNRLIFSETFIVFSRENGIILSKFIMGAYGSAIDWKSINHNLSVIASSYERERERGEGKVGGR